MELLDLYDDDGKLIGKSIERGTKFDEGNIMLSIVFIKNNEGKYLIQKTSLEKGSEYTSTGGHVTHGEMGLNTIIRELQEEIGLVVNSNELMSLGLVKHPSRPCLIDLYLLEKEINIEDLVLQLEEVESVSWLTEKEILELIENNEFIASHGFLFKNYII